MPFVTPVIFLSSVHVFINLIFTCHVFNAMFVVLSCHLVDVQGSLPRVENATFRGRASRRSVGTCNGRFAMARWARFRFCPALGLLAFVFSCVGPVVGLPDVGFSDFRIVGLSDCFGNGFPQRLGMF